ncbi:hypothetical protein PIB30_074511 [Stylosanthes scabra]|uniref:Uncharacterized protein n=1 Tax=Stylosanthes scabra TaxID=79078 RepID=A0ABU6ZNG7_9FABA|nr:hypothetical protein [Stylosanthes scabra]
MKPGTSETSVFPSPGQLFRILGPKGPNPLRYTYRALRSIAPAQTLCGPTSCSINPQRIEVQLIMIPYGFIPHNLGESVQDQRGSTPLSGTSSKPYHIACVRRAPKSLFGEALLAHTHLSHKPSTSTFRLSTSGYAGSPKPLEGTSRTSYNNFISLLNPQNDIVSSRQKATMRKNNITTKSSS